MRKTIYSILLGIGGGVIMAVILLYMMMAEGFIMWTAGFWLCLAAAAALPSCLQIFARSDAFRILLSELIMIAVSFLITVVYAVYASRTGSAGRFINVFSMVMSISSVCHGVSLVMTLVIHVLQLKRRKP